MLAFCAGKKVTLVNMKGHILSEFEMNGPVGALEWSTDGQKLFCGGDERCVRVYGA